MTKKVNVFRYEVTPEGEDWWAECLLCGWVCASNSDQRTAEMKFGRHYQDDHAPDQARGAGPRAGPGALGH